MKIAILSRNPKLYSTDSLVKAAKKRGHEVRVIDHVNCYMDINSNDPKVYYKKEALKFDAIIPRIGTSVTFYGAAILRQLEMNGAYALNESLAITRSRDKLRAHQILAKKRIGMPITGFSHSATNTDELIKNAGGAPLVLKLLQGTQGKGVILAETKTAASAVIEAFSGLDAFFLVQEFIKESDGADIRCFVVGDKVVAAMKRQGGEGEFRSNLHRGGAATIVKLSSEERKTALAAAKVRGPLVLEVNSSPGLEGIETTTGKDVANMIIEFIEKNAKCMKNSKINKG
jgi:ribosomal protein S6--L-glutamate ligase